MLLEHRSVGIYTVATTSEKLIGIALQAGLCLVLED